jgi:predicted alpha/beta superfamily hydrolase
MHRPRISRQHTGFSLFGAWLIGVVLSAFLASPADAATPQRLIEVGGAYSLHSDVLNEQRQYFVHLPPSYWRTSSAQRRYPVLYMLDGENFFVTAADVTDFMSGGTNGNYAIPEMIVVGVINTQRTRDMTPTHIVHGAGGIGDWSSSGRSDRFFDFLERELIPRIDRDYRTLPYRVAAGHSLAGLAVVNAFQLHPEMFQASIALDPSLWWDDSYSLRLAQKKPAFASGHNRLYIGLANTPSIDGMYSGIAKVHMDAIRAYASFMSDQDVTRKRFELDYFPNEEHGSVPLVALYNGLAFTFLHYKLTFAEGLNHPDHIGEHFNRVSVLLGINLPPPEALLNVMGYMAMNDLKEPNKAVSLFELATSYYPQSSNAYESLGEGHANAGQRAQAHLDYQKALELDPDNMMAKDALLKLEHP